MTYFSVLLFFSTTSNITLASMPSEDAWGINVRMGESEREMYLLPSGDVVDFQDNVFGKWTKVTSPKGTYWLMEGSNGQIFVAGEVGRKWKGVFWENYETEPIACEYEITPPTTGRDSTPRDVDVSYWLIGGVIEHFFAQGIGDLQLRGNGITRVNNKQSRFYNWSAHLNQGDKLFLIAKTSKGRRFYWKRKSAKKSEIFHGVNFGEKDVSTFFAKLNWPGNGQPQNLEDMEVVEVKGLLKAQPRIETVAKSSSKMSEASREVQVSNESETMFQDGWKFSAVGHRWGGPRFLSPDGIIYRGDGTVAGSWSQIDEQFVVMRFSSTKEVYAAWKSNTGKWQGMYLIQGDSGLESGSCPFMVLAPKDGSMNPIPDEDISEEFVGLTQISSTGETLFLSDHGQLLANGALLGRWSARRDHHGDTYLVLVSQDKPQVYWKTGISWSGLGYDGSLISGLTARLGEAVEQPPKTDAFLVPDGIADALKKRGPDSGAAYVWPDLAGVAGTQKPWSLARDFKSYLGRDYAPWGSYTFNGATPKSKEFAIYSPDLSTVFFTWQQDSSWRGILKDRGGIRVIGDVVVQDNGRLNGGSSPADTSFAGKSLSIEDPAMQWDGPSMLRPDGSVYNRHGQRRGSWAAMCGPDGKTFLSLHFFFSDQNLVLWQKSGQWTGIWEWRNRAGSLKQIQFAN